MALTTQAHNAPSQLPEPSSIPEAWNVIELSAANIDQLLQSGLLSDIPFQLVNAGTAIQFLQSHATGDAQSAKLEPLTKQWLTGATELIRAAKEQNPSRAAATWEACRKSVKEMESQYAPEVVHAAVYVCPMHPMDRHLKAEEPCSVCGMSLIRRRLPASTIYEKPGEPTMKLRVVGSPLVVGRIAAIKIQLNKADGSPVTLADLLEMHTEKIHLLINDRSLSDYHHEHPKPTRTPGEYQFSFTPTKPGPYRVWADLVPVATTLQEYVIADIPADTAPAPLTDRPSSLTTVVNGRKYELTLNTGEKPIHAGDTVVGAIAVSGADGKPFTDLEPIMGTYSHIVGFSEDQKTVIHIHPYGRNPTRPEDRGGPAFAFKLHVPSAGFLRLYGQVQIGGVSQFAPFGLMILAAEKPTTSP